MARKFLNHVVLAGALLLPALASAEVVVIVHPSVSASGSQGDVANLFLGKATALGGTALEPVDQEDGSDAREEFYQKATGKSPAQLNAYWSRIVFTGKGQPPRAVGDDDAVKEAVAKNKSLIGYIDADALDSSVKKVVSVK